MRRVPVTSGRPLWPWNSFGYIQRQSYSATSVSRPSARYESPANGPLSTLPAPLDVPPPRKPGEGIFGYYFKVGKGYLTFYKTGLKNAAWVNPKLASPVLRRWKESEGYKGFHQNNWITRGDLQLLKRHSHDFRRLPLFALLFTVCGEFTPFVVVLFSNIVPGTCRIPSQVRADREKRERLILASFESFLPFSSINRRAERLEQLTWKEKVHCSTVVGRHGGWWPSKLLPLPPSFILDKRLERYELYLAADDKLIVKGGGVMVLSHQELEIACLDRGIRVLGKTEQELRAALQKWLQDSKRGVTIWERWLAKA